MRSFWMFDEHLIYNFSLITLLFHNKCSLPQIKMEPRKDKVGKGKTSAQTTNFLKFRAVKFSCLSNFCKKKEKNF